MYRVLLFTNKQTNSRENGTTTKVVE